MNRARTFVFLGSSGAGKGTQVALLSDYLKQKGTQRVLCVSTGNLFRTFITRSTYTADKVRELLDAGGLPREFLAIWIWTGYLNENIKDNTEHVILDGVTRRVEEAPVLAGAVEFYDRTADIVVLNVSRACARKRLRKRGRYDDNVEDIKARLDWFERDVRPSIEYFRSHSRCSVHDIDGEQSVEEVHREILKKMGL